MKILFAYFGNPRYLKNNITNHITIANQIKKNIGAQVDFLFTTTWPTADVIDVVQNVCNLYSINVMFDCIEEQDRAIIAKNIHNKTQYSNFDRTMTLKLFYQLISMHLLALKIPTDYDAVYILRTDILFVTDPEFDFDAVNYIISSGLLKKNLYVTYMEIVLGHIMKIAHIDDRIFLVGSTCLKELYVENFENKMAAYIDEICIKYKDQALEYVNDHHTCVITFLATDLVSSNLRITNKSYSFIADRLMPRNSLCRTSYNDTWHITVDRIIEIENQLLENDKVLPDFITSFAVDEKWFND